jgi:hypothetical protein
MISRTASILSFIGLDPWSDPDHATHVCSDSIDGIMCDSNSVVQKKAEAARTAARQLARTAPTTLEGAATALDYIIKADDEAILRFYNEYGRRYTP